MSDKTFICDQCPKSYKGQRELRRHIREKHENPDQTFTCESCDAKLSSQRNLNRHTKTVHGSKEHVCNICKETFTQKTDLTSHKKIHEKRMEHFDCAKCDKTFPSALGLKRHNDRDHTEKKKEESKKAEPKPKRRKIEKIVIEGDPAIFTPDLIEDTDPNLISLYRANWHQICNRSVTRQPLQDVYNFRLTGPATLETLSNFIRHVFTQQQNAFKLSISFGSILKNIETDLYRYFYSCSNNACLLEKPVTISTEVDLQNVISSLDVVDLLELARLRRPDTKWVVFRITNLTLYVNKLIDHPIGKSHVLPAYLMNNQGMHHLVWDQQHQNMFTDNKCIFRCMALHLGYDIRALQNATTNLFDRYIQETGTDPRYFRGITLNNLLGFEDIFEVNINIYQLKENDEGHLAAKLHRRSLSLYSETMNLNLYEDHFSFIHTLAAYSHSFRCANCDTYFVRAWDLHRHMTTCDIDIKEKYPGGAYHPELTVFESLEEVGITIPRKYRIYRHLAVFDFETSPKATDEVQKAPKLTWIAEHIPISVSIRSNVEGFRDAKCIVSQGDTRALVDDFLEYLLEISNASFTILVNKFKTVFEVLGDLLKKAITKEIEESDQDFDKRLKKFHLYKLQESFYNYLRELPVIGFNSMTYDINCIKQDFFPLLTEKLDLQYAIKKNNSYMTIKTPALKFLDITNYLAPGFSYASFLKAYSIPEAKGYFCYDWLDSFEKLDHTSLPPHGAFYNSLKCTNISDAEYAYCQQVWEEKGMETFKDFLIWYNNLDVIGFVPAIEKMIDYYESTDICMLKDGVSVPTLTLKYLFKTLDKDIYFTLLDENNQDLLKTMKSNIVGGPSIVFHRYQETGKTKIREADYGREAKTTKRTFGYDANALYLHGLMDKMPTQHPIRRRAENNFKPETQRGFDSLEWMRWYGFINKVEIQHKFNGKEKRFENRLVDGWIKKTQTVLEYDGCFFHACDCGIVKNPREGGEQKRLDDKEKTKFLEGLGLTVIRMKECEWREMRKEPEISTFLNENVRKPLYYRWQMSEKQILEAIMDDKIFGMVEVDIHTPENLKKSFEDLPPIFKNVEISRDDIGDFMKSYAEETNTMTKPRKSLISSYFGNKILTTTPLLQWYVSHGLEVTKIYQVVQYLPKKAFEAFGNEVSDARRLGDKDPSKKIIAETKKLKGNSGYGRTVTNLANHKDIKYLNKKKASRAINKSRFRALNPISEELYEVTMAKKVVNYNLPMQIGFFVYAYAKLRMLEFVFDFLHKFIAPEDFQPCQMDTDSYYFTISAESLDDVIRPELREQYEAEKCNWFPRDGEFAAYDKRTPGLFKEEYVGDGIIALCSKTYYCFGETDKFSSKGLNKRQNDITKEKFLNVLETKKSGSGVNRGFRMRGNTMWTYTQERDALSYFYPKRQVLSDGVSTKPLLI